MLMPTLRNAGASLFKWPDSTLGVLGQELLRRILLIGDVIQDAQ